MVQPGRTHHKSEQRGILFVEPVTACYRKSLVRSTITTSTMEQVLSPSRMDSRAAFPAPAANPLPSRFAGKRVHFIGIGGSGMNGLARILLDCGAVVSGSDPNP